MNKVLLNHWSKSVVYCIDERQRFLKKHCSRKKKRCIWAMATAANSTVEKLLPKRCLNLRQRIFYFKQYFSIVVKIKKWCSDMIFQWIFINLHQSNEIFMHLTLSNLCFKFVYAYKVHRTIISM